jgi:hypothetical protein
VGGVLLATYQAAKFAELDMGDPTTRRYVARLPAARASDFVGAQTYGIGLCAFLAASLLLYYGACQFSGTILEGALKLFTGNASATVPTNIAKPLYIAALFMGLTQPVIPVLARLGDAQRNFFHKRIEIPRGIIDLTENVAAAIGKRSAQQNNLMAELKRLVSDDWLSELAKCGDLAFYRQRLEEIELDPGAAAKTLQEASPRELRKLLEEVVFFNLIAVARKSGPKQLSALAQKLNPEHTPDPPVFLRFISGLLLSGIVFTVAVLIIWNALDATRETVVIPYLGSPNLWPNSTFIGREIGRIVWALFGCALIAAYMAPEGLGPRTSAHAGSTINADFLVRFGQAVAGPLGLCFLAALVIQIIAELYLYGTGRDFANLTSYAKPTILLVRTLPSVALCYCVMLYLAVREEKQVSFPLMLCVIGVLISVLSLLVVVTFLRFDFLHALPTLLPTYKGRGLEYAAFYVLANTLVAMAAFSSIILFFRAQEASRGQ